MNEIAIPRHAATVILVRDSAEGPRVLMGQRGKGASFMPSKFVFPGGALDASDQALAGGFPMRVECARRLAFKTPPEIKPDALALAAVRETWEETGLTLGREGAGVEDAPEDWRDFFATGLTPATDALEFVFRAITPPTRHKRFDARFFLAHADHFVGDPDDLSRASGELSHLNWLTLKEARAVDLPFVTEVVLAEVEARLNAPDSARPTPFFHHEGERSYMDHLR